MSDDDQPSAILGTTTTVRTMADGTLRISIDIEPRHAAAAFGLFGAPGSPVAIARIMPEVAKSQARQETIDHGHPVGGPLAKLAGQFCEAAPFREWLRIKYTPKPRDAKEAAQIIRSVCKIDSRAYLDHLPEAAAIFHEKFRLPYNAWLNDGMK